jgi:meso-butanediol dehydrogenase / (S,S)-butanediol dehydrogenase / diacetyl reductase
MRLDGKNAIITGAGTGIGAATARLFASLGANCVLVGPDAAPLEQVATEIGGLSVVADAADRNAMAAAVSLAKDRFGPVDTLVNCAGGGGNAPLLDLEDSEWSRALRIWRPHGFPLPPRCRILRKQRARLSSSRHWRD